MANFGSHRLHSHRRSRSSITFMIGTIIIAFGLLTATRMKLEMESLGPGTTEGTPDASVTSGHVGGIPKAILSGSRNDQTGVFDTPYQDRGGGVKYESADQLGLGLGLGLVFEGGDEWTKEEKDEVAEEDEDKEDGVSDDIVQGGR